MSKIIATSAIAGAHQILAEAEEALQKAMDTAGPEQAVELPNTGYYLPVIYGLTGIRVEKVKDIEQVLEHARELLPEPPAERLWTPYLGTTLDAGIATLFSEEIIESLKYVLEPGAYTETDAPTDDNLWLGAADDVIMRERGVEFVDGTAPGFAAITGAAPDVETAVQIANELKQKMLYVFIAGKDQGVSFAEQLVEGGVELGWNTRLVPFSPSIYGHIFSLGFATRAALAFGGVEAGDYRNILKYNKDRIFAFVLAFGEVTDKKYATAAGAISYGFPTIATSDIPEILPTGVCTYEHVVSNVPCDEIVARAIEVRGLKVVVTEVPVPVAYSPAFEGERIRKGEYWVELAGPKSVGCEFTEITDDVDDGKIEVIGPEIDDLEEEATVPFAIHVKVSGRKMQKDFEPILERQGHSFFNEAEGVLHMGQRDTIWMRISKRAHDAGFNFEHLGKIIHARYHADFGTVVDKVQVNIYTREEDVEKILEVARKAYQERDDRLGSLTDESVDTFYSCILCQSFAPTHVCVITPERPGLCGSYNWLDGKAAYEMNPTGGNQPVPKGETIDDARGQWSGVNDYVKENSQGTVEAFNTYSMMEDPMTSCGCFEVISCVLPMCNGIMTVNREYKGETPSGMKFSTLAGSVGGGVQSPGFLGHSRFYMGSPKFISADGGIKRLVWMPKELKEEMREILIKAGERVGVPDLVDKIATEEDGIEEDQVLEYLTKVGHPALEMDPLF
ncbi:carbon monoxide dehydrogenase/acetyl-CoA synthase subunit alpha [bacterium BMS3Abin01]|nr:carbon monoxide dehydrogenase/acetyl-CoA synthase subunit alpha [bacterium BMS3Abin01]HDZ59568.1 CO dehydrogenase/CO-methylating acetyl-CoA synthase complex subunit beta [Actinomycetota bacterium]